MLRLNLCLEEVVHLDTIRILTVDILQRIDSLGDSLTSSDEDAVDVKGQSEFIRCRELASGLGDR